VTKAYKQIETRKNIVKNLLLNQLNKKLYPWDNESIDNVNSIYIDYDENGCITNKTYLNPLYNNDKTQEKCISKDKLLEINKKIEEKDEKKILETRANKIPKSLIDKCNEEFLKQLEILDIYVALPVYNRDFLQNVLKEANNYELIIEIIVHIQETILQDYYKTNIGFENLMKLQLNFSLSLNPPQLPWSKIVQDEIFKLDHKDLNLNYKSINL
jgi:hypothetical protein